MENFTKDITFLIDRKGKIYYNPCDLFDHHEDLIEDNGVSELDCCRLVYKPSGDESFCGIKGIEASCNIMWDATPFELKNTHLNAIENFISNYDKMVEYEKRNYNSDSATRPGRDINTMNNLTMLGLGYVPNSPSKKEEKVEKTDEEMFNSVISTETKLTEIDKTKSTVKYTYNVDMMRYIELSEQLAQDSQCPSSMYWTMSGRIIDSIMRKITDRACEIEDDIILNYLTRLGYAERIED